MARPVLYPQGTFPPVMQTQMAAAYCGETDVNSFLRRVGTRYPDARVKDGRRRFWYKDDLDMALGLKKADDMEDAADLL